jgi:hypothetical protein
MRQCRRCDSVTLRMDREEHVLRHGHNYSLFWFLCPVCGDVGFSYTIDGSPPTPEVARTQLPAPTQAPTPDADPVLTS